MINIQDLLECKRIKVLKDFYIKILKHNYKIVLDSFLMFIDKPIQIGTNINLKIT